MAVRVVVVVVWAEAFPTGIEAAASRVVAVVAVAVLVPAETRACSARQEAAAEAAWAAAVA